jgi:hypothetical protein
MPSQTLPKEKVGIVERFKKSHLGQLVIVASIAATVVSGLYERIRLPTLAGQISYRDDKVKDFETQIQKQKDEIKEQKSELDTARIQSAKHKSTFEHAQKEIAELSAKLTQSQQAQGKLDQELNTLKLTSLQSPTTPSSTNITEAGRSVIINLEQAILATADQEDTAFLVVDNNLTELRSASYAAHVEEFRNAVSQPYRIQDVPAFISNAGNKVNEYYDFRLTLEKLRVVSTKETLKHYRRALVQSSKSTPDVYLSQIRQKPAIIAQIAELAKKLKAKENSDGWNKWSTKEVNDFMNSLKPPLASE